jgi:hypothetical protein
MRSSRFRKENLARPSVAFHWEYRLAITVRQLDIPVDETLPGQLCYKYDHKAGIMVIRLSTRLRCRAGTPREIAAH